jgi:hypothetical protein
MGLPLREGLLLLLITIYSYYYTYFIFIIKDPFYEKEPRGLNRGVYLTSQLPQVFHSYFNLRVD